MDWIHAFGWATSAGFVLAMLARVIPQIQNSVVPKIAFVSTFLGNLVLLWGKFATAAGAATVGGEPHPVLLASFWNLPGIHQALVFCGTVGSTALGLFAQRLAHEYGLKSLVGKDPAL